MSIPPLMTNLADVCRAPAAEMESNGFHDGAWSVTFASSDTQIVQFTNQKRTVCIEHNGDPVYTDLRWHVMDDRCRVGGSGPTLAEAVAAAKAQGWPL